MSNENISNTECDLWSLGPFFISLKKLRNVQHRVFWVVENTSTLRIFLSYKKKKFSPMASKLFSSFASMCLFACNWIFYVCILGAWDYMFVNVSTSLCVFAHVWAISQVTHVNRSFSLQVNPVELYCCCKLWWVMSDDTAVDWQRLKGESELFCSTLHLTTQILIKRTCSCQNISAHQQVWSSSERTDSMESDECQTRSRRGITTV